MWQPALGAVTTPLSTSFRVWAPKRANVELELYGGDGSPLVLPMREEGGYWSVTVDTPAGGGLRYRYRVDSEAAFPDPCSRSQPDGVHGASATVDPNAFQWSDASWKPPHVADLVIFECHIGTLIPGGTFEAAVGQLPRLRALGVTAIEVMPIAAFPGRWNWGYDGVSLFAPSHMYGGPEGFRAFVDAAHAHGLAVILDVVYNHFGPDGNYTGVYSDEYLTDRYQTPWGDAVNFDGPGSDHVRGFFRENLLHWTHEYHVDGFRFDATHAIFDSSPQHILAELSSALEEHPRDGFVPYLIAESHENDVRYLRPTAEGGHAFDAVWADDFHHVIRTAIHRDRDGYFGSFTGDAAELARTIEQGFLFEGQQDQWAGEPRGTQAREQPWSQFVYCIQNHDQVGNRAFGQRLNVTAAHEDYLAASLLLLLLPQTPMLFQGQEFLATTPFLYFTDHDTELGRLVTEGRRREFGRFKAFADPRLRERIPDPQSPDTFDQSKLRLAEATTGIGMLCHDFYADALALRASDPVLVAARRERAPMRVRASGKAVLVEIDAAAGKRLIAFNLGDEAGFSLDGAWLTAITSCEPRFGGNGDAPVISGGTLKVPARSAAFLVPASGA